MKTIHVVSWTLVLHIPAIPHHVADPVAAYHAILQFSPTSSPNQVLLTIHSGSKQTIVTVKMLAKALKIMLKAIDLDSSLYYLRSLRRRGATAAYTKGVQQLDIKHHGLWSSDSFWQYVTSRCTHQSPVEAALAASVAAS